MASAHRKQTSMCRTCLARTRYYVILVGRQMCFHWGIQVWWISIEPKKSMDEKRKLNVRKTELEPHTFHIGSSETITTFSTHDKTQI